MTVTNDFLPFCPDDLGTNLESQSDYLADAARTDGNSSGVASSKLINKALRQPSYVVSQLAQFISNFTSTSVLDDAEPAKLLAQMNAALSFLAPLPTVLTATGSHTYNLPYVFFTGSANATATATYSDGATVFTVQATVASGTQIIATGAAAPVASGTLTKTGGTGDATITFYAVRAPVALRCVLVGAGGSGGSAGGTSNTGNAGTASTVNSTLLIANPGAGGGSESSQVGGAGGSATIGAGPVGLGIAGSTGGCTGVGATAQSGGGNGGTSALGGSGGGGINSAGASAAANSGSGGGGGSGGVTGGGGGGGGSGAFIDVLITTLLSTYTIVIGTKGSGPAGTVAAGNGGDGICMMTALYQ